MEDTHTASTVGCVPLRRYEIQGNKTTGEGTTGFVGR